MIQRYREIKRQRAAGELDASGFTLIELLIVIVVLGILAAVVVFALGGVTGSSIVSACNADAKTVEVAVAAYEANTGNTAAACASYTACTTEFVPKYLQSWPQNTGSNYAIVMGQATGDKTDTVDVEQGAQWTAGVYGTPTSTVAYTSTACTGATT